MKIYIAGPMSGKPNWNYDNFNRVAKDYQEIGWTVYNPAQKDVENGVDDPEAMKDGNTALAIQKGTFSFRDSYEWDVCRVIESDAIYMLEGWEHSPGACGEHAVAVAMKKHYPDYQIIYESA